MVSHIVELQRAIGIESGTALLTSGPALNAGPLAAIREQLAIEKGDVDAISHLYLIHAAEAHARAGPSRRLPARGMPPHGEAAGAVAVTIATYFSRVVSRMSAKIRSFKLRQKSSATSDRGLNRGERIANG
mgnify:CR=1 FL=1